MEQEEFPGVTLVGEVSTLPTRVLEDPERERTFRYRKGLESRARVLEAAAQMTYGEINEILASVAQEKGGVDPPMKWFGMFHRFNKKRKCIQCGEASGPRWPGPHSIDNLKGRTIRKVVSGFCDPCGNRLHRYSWWLESEDIRWSLIIGSRDFNWAQRAFAQFPFIRGRIPYYDPTQEESIWYFIEDRFSTIDLQDEAEDDAILRILDSLYKRIYQRRKRRKKLRRSKRNVSATRV